MTERRFKLRLPDGQEREIVVRGEWTAPAVARLSVDGVSADAQVVELRASSEGSWMLELPDSQRVIGTVSSSGVSVSLGGRTVLLERLREGASGRAELEQDERLVRAPMPGKVVELRASVGASVSPDEPVAVVEAMKLQNSVFAARSGVVAEIHVKVGDQVAADEPLISLEVEE